MVDFGYDTSCTTSLRTGRFAAGPRLVAEACFRRLSTPHGTLRGGDAEADYGLDLLNVIGNATTASAAAALPGQIQSELLKDERVSQVDATVNSSIDSAGAVSWTIAIEATTDEGPFTLVLSVNDVTVEILGLTA